MEEEFTFPSQLWVLLDEDTPTSLVFMTDAGAWVREDGEWVEFVIDDKNPKRRFEGMLIAPVDPRIIDLWDAQNGELSDAEVDPFEYKWNPPSVVGKPEDAATKPSN